MLKLKEEWKAQRTELGVVGVVSLVVALAVIVATRSPLFDPGGWIWESWLKCSAVGTSAGCATAAIGCIVTNIASPFRLGVLCGGAAVGSMVGCAVAQLLY